MEDKTLIFLNSKMWYRFIKVSYIFVFFVLIVGYNILFVFSKNLKEINQDKTQIECKYTINKTVFSPSEIGVNLTMTDIIANKYNGTGGELDKILGECLKRAKQGVSEDTQGQSTKNVTFEEFSNRLPVSRVSMFNIKPVFAYNQFLLYFFIGNLIILFAFEFFRRCFYYIVLGNMRPRK
ncbi:MAG: hypothetical protein WCK10_01735 [Candidatus Staskawiczbacteria bacterium]